MEIFEYFWCNAKILRRQSGQQSYLIQWRRHMRAMFTAFATKTAKAMGSIWAFLLALLIIIIWGITGPLFHYSDTWQLVINTGTTIITFLMVFLIQNTQNRDARAMHLKLDELILSLKSAHNEMLDIEELTDEQLEKIAETYRKKKEACESETPDAIKEDRETDE